MRVFIAVGNLRQVGSGDVGVGMGDGSGGREGEGETYAS